METAASNEPDHGVHAARYYAPDLRHCPVAAFYARWNTDMNLNKYSGRSLVGGLRRAFPASAKEWLGVFVSVFAIIAFFRTCAHDRRLSDLNYTVLSLGHQPRLTLASSPRLSRITIDSLLVSARSKPEQNAPVIDKGDTLDLRFQLTIEASIRIANASEHSLAKILAVVSTDTIPSVRGFITGRQMPDRWTIQLQRWPRLANSHLLPGDTLEVPVTTVVRYIKNRLCALHIITIYQNELENLYHTHSMVPYRLQPFAIPFDGTTEAESLKRVVHDALQEKISHGAFMRSLAPVNKYATYDRKETAQAMRHLEHMMPGIGP